MTPATTLAAAAGGIAAVGVTELARDWTPRRRPPLRRLASRVLARAGHRFAASAPRDLAARLETAGLDTPPGDVMALKTGAALLALFATLPLAATLAPLTAAGAFLAPDLLIRRRARARSETIDAELGDVLDLLRVAVAAGLSPGRALREVGRRHGGTLAAELDRAAQATVLGVPLADALAALERRAPSAGVPPLIGTLRRAARHGAPLGPALAAQAAEARARTARRHTERAARAAPQVQLVVALLLVPSVLLLVAAALVPA
jgi:tight adherence protein C